MGATHPGDLTDPNRPVVPHATDYRRGHRIARHHHFRAQFLHAVAGVMRVSSASGAWVVPPHQAVWVPAGIDHEVECPGPVSMRSLYVHPRAAARLPARCCVVAVRPLLRELIRRVAQPAGAVARGAAHARLVAVILDELEAMEPAPLYLPLPVDPRVRAVTEALRRDPGDPRTLAAWGRVAGASSRTLARLFLRETGMSFAVWRQQLRLHEALARLASGQTTTRVAYDLGYRSPSAFVAMFRRALGQAPGRYLRVR